MAIALLVTAAICIGAALGADQPILALAGMVVLVPAVLFARYT